MDIASGGAIDSMDNHMFRKESGVATTNTAKEHWGVKFSVVPNGLSEEEVVSFVDDLMKSSKSSDDKQASLIKLAEQTVIEADKTFLHASGEETCKIGLNNTYSTQV